MLKIIIEIAKTAGELILEVYNSSGYDIKLKDDNSPLTVADQKSHDFIIGELRKNFPNIPVISEEGKNILFEERRDWTKFFLVDPLDGTKEFIKRNGEFTVNIALIENNTPVMGIIHVPVEGTTYLGEEKKGAWKEINDNNGSHEIIGIRVSNKTTNEELNVVQSRNHSGEEEEEFYSKFKIKDKLSKGSSLKICLVAEGKADLYYRSGPTWEWDTAAGHAILNAAGGYLVNKDKSDIIYNKEAMKNFGFIAGGIKWNNEPVDNE